MYPSALQLSLLSKIIDTDMWNNLKVLSITHQTAVIDIREMVQLKRNQAKSLMLKVKDLFDMEDVWVLTAPDRVEIFYRYDKAMKNELVWLLCQACGIPNWRSFLSSFNSITDHSDAVVYFLEVSTGMHSAIPGDRDVYAQMQNAFADSLEVEASTIFQGQLLSSMNRVAKRLYKEVEEDDNPSLGSAAAMLAQQILRERKKEAILLLGSGPVTERIVGKLLGNGYTNLTILDVSLPRAVNLADATGVAFLPLSKLKEEVSRFKMVISDLNCDQPVITTECFTGSNEHVNQYFIDLSVKRSIDPFIACLDGKFIFNVDVLRDSTAGFFIPDHEFQTRTQKVICEEYLNFLSQTDRLQSSSAMSQFRDVLEDVRQSAMAMHGGEMGKEGLDVLHRITETMVADISKLTVEGLRTAQNKGRDGELLNALGELFGLNKGPEIVHFKDTGSMGTGRRAS